MTNINKFEDEDGPFTRGDRVFAEQELGHIISFIRLENDKCNIELDGDFSIHELRLIIGVAKLLGFKEKG